MPLPAVRLAHPAHAALDVLTPLRHPLPPDRRGVRQARAVDAPEPQRRDRLVLGRPKRIRQRQEVLLRQAAHSFLRPGKRRTQARPPRRLLLRRHVLVQTPREIAPCAQRQASRLRRIAQQPIPQILRQQRPIRCLRLARRRQFPGHVHQLTRRLLTPLGRNRRLRESPRPPCRPAETQKHRHRRRHACSPLHAMDLSEVTADTPSSPTGSIVRQRYAAIVLGYVGRTPRRHRTRPDP